MNPFMAPTAMANGFRGIGEGETRSEGFRPRAFWADAEKPAPRSPYPGMDDPEVIALIKGIESGSIQTITDELLYSIGPYDMVRAAMARSGIWTYYHDCVWRKSNEDPAGLTSCERMRYSET